MLRGDIQGMRSAGDVRLRQQTNAEDLLMTAEHWPEVAAVMTDAERAELLGLLVSDVPVSADDRVTVSGNLGCAIERFGSPTWIRTTNTAVNSRVLYR
jgi:hypothetical protein